MARKPAQVTLAKPGARIRVCFTVIMVIPLTMPCLAASLLVTTLVYLFQERPAVIQVSWIQEVLSIIQSTVNDSSAACLLTSTCAPLQRLKNIPHSHVVGLHRQEQWHHRASILHLHGIVNIYVYSPRRQIQRKEIEQIDRGQNLQSNRETLS